MMHIFVLVLLSAFYLAGILQDNEHSNIMCNSTSQHHVHFPQFYVQYY